MIYLFPLFFWLQLVYFFVCTTLAFFLPGSLVVSNLKTDRFTKFVLAEGIGMILWGFQGLLLGYLHIRWVSYFYLLGIVLLIIFRWNKKISFPKFSLKINRLTFFLLFVGSFVQLVTVFFNGIPTGKGAYYCCGEPRDNLLHIAITKSVTHSIPPLEPGMSGVVIKNYHYLSSVVVGELVRVFGLPLVATEFQFMTIWISLLFGLLLISFGRVVYPSETFIQWLLFFFYFGGDFVFGLVFFATHKLDFSMSSLEDGTKFLANYPRAFAIDGLIIGLILLTLWLREKQNKMVGILMSIVIGSLISFKVYIGIFALSGMFILSCFMLYRRNFSFLLFTLTAFLISAALYVPVNASAGGLFFTGFWLFENFIVQPGFGLIRLELARTIYAAHHSWLRVFSYELLYMLIYVVAIFGTKILAVIQTKKSFQKFPLQLHIFLFSGLVVSFIAGAFFQQSSGGANTFNFLVNVFLVLSFYAALACTMLVEVKLPKILKLLIIFCIILLTIPRVTVETYENLYRVFHGQGLFIDNEQLQVFAFMKKQLPASGIVAVDQQYSFEFDKETPYVYVYTNQQMYLSGQVDEFFGHGISFLDRQKKVDALIRGNVCSQLDILYHTPITYILTQSFDRFTSTDSAKFLRPMVKTSNYTLLEVQGASLKKTYESDFLGPEKICY